MLQEDLVCPSCRKPYDLPLLLPCSHSQCRACVLQEKNMAASRKLGKHSQGSQFPGESCSIYCPTCQGPVELPSPSWEAAMIYLPVNWPLKALLEVDQESYGDCMVPKQDLERKEDSEWRKPTKALSANGSRTLKEIEASSGDGDEGAAGVAPVRSPKGWCSDMDIAEEEIELSLKGLHFRLDPSTAHPLMTVSPSGLQVTYTGPALSSCSLPSESRAASTCNTASTSTLLQVGDDGDAPKNPQLPQVLADVSIRGGLFYWEVDVCNSQAYRLGVCSGNVTSSDASCHSCHSWCLERQLTGTFRALYDEEEEHLDSVPPLVQRIGVCLNMTGGTLSFYSAITEEHFVTLPISFPCPVRPFFYLTQGKLSITSGLPLPAFVFTTKDSAYRAGKGRSSSWHQDLIFRSISPFIQRFEHLGLEDNNVGFRTKMRSLCTRNMKCQIEAKQIGLNNDKL